jgi:Sulfotransferase domain
VTRQTPILVTGMARSGTTWAGRMLEASDEVLYIDEPLNVRHSLGLFGRPIDRWYPYICTENESEYIGAIRDLVNLRYHVLAELKSARSWLDVRHAAEAWTRFTLGRLSRKRPLIKEPHAVLSGEWFATRVGCQVVVTVRHPAGVVSSWKRLGWDFDFENILNQPFAVRDLLGPFRSDIVDMQHRSGDFVGRVALLWRIVYSVVAQLQTRLPDLRVVRHEDLSRAPESNYAKLYQALDLSLTEGALETIRRTSSAENPSEITRQDPYAFQVDSQANLWNWRERLSTDEVERVRSLTKDVAGLYYGDVDWG